MPLNPIGYQPTEREFLESLKPTYSSFEKQLKNCVQVSCSKEMYESNVDLFKDFQISSRDIVEEDGSDKTIYTLLKYSPEDVGQSERCCLELIANTSTTEQEQ